MFDNSFLCQCIADTINGLNEGLSHFSGLTRIALIYALKPEDPIRIFDPQNLLEGHEPKFKELYLDSQEWRKAANIERGKKRFSHIVPEENLDLAGLISYGGRSSTVFYQMWFTEHHPDMCSIGPVERWLEHAVLRFSHDIANEKELYTGISGNFLREYATHAVRDFIVDRLNVLLGWDTQIRTYSILDTILGISRTREEGAWPRGVLAFIEPGRLSEVDLTVEFPRIERPNIENYKHVCKLLVAVEGSDRKLISDGKSIVGITMDHVPEYAIVADFQGGHGFLRLQDKNICSFADGSFRSTTFMAKLVQVEEILLESSLDHSIANTLFQIIAAIVHNAEQAKYGCTPVIDLNNKPLDISGQKLHRPLDLQQDHFLELAKSLARVDGALHVCIDLCLRGFACLLDGHSISGEDRSRGARFNSALRFTAEHENVFIVVVSADRPVSIIQDGIELSAQCRWNPLGSIITLPPTVEEWIMEKG